MRWYDLVPPRSPRAEDFPRELAGDHTDYTPFIVLTAPRSGSSMLVQSLRAHAGIVSFGELFNRKHIGFNTPGFANQNRRLQSWRNRHPVEFTKTMVYRGYAARIEAVGFKIFHLHLDRPQLHLLRRYLVEKPGLRIIHLRRRNLLRTFLSRTIAGRTGIWGIPSPEQRSPLRVRLEPAGCLEYFETVSRQWAEYDEFFRPSTLLDVNYETLVGAFGEEMERVQRFLGVERTDLPRLTIQQEVRSLPEAIENYAELESALAGTSWSVFLDG